MLLILSVLSHSVGIDSTLKSAWHLGNGLFAVKKSSSCHSLGFWPAIQH